MIVKNVKCYTEECSFEEGTIYIKGERFAEESELQEFQELVIDGEGCYAIPGLIDLHFHGCRGADFCDGTREAFAEICAYEASVGVTCVAPATMTLPVPELERILSAAADYREHPEAGADLVGINMEGPFISPVKKGAQNEAHILPCDTAVCRRFLQASRGLVKFVGMAPEESQEALDFIRQVKDQVHVSLAHTNADYETAYRAFQAGADHVVHLYNAMSPFTHREPGVIGAAADCDHVWAELICDGIHVHPAAVRAAFRMFGEERILLISDSMRATGMPDGRYTLGGLDVQVTGRRAELVSDGALAGSVTNLMDCVRIAVKEMDIPLETAVRCAAVNPAKRLEIQEDYGSINAGKYADLVLLDQDLRVKTIIKRGTLLQRPEGGDHENIQGKRL